MLVFARGTAWQPQQGLPASIELARSCGSKPHWGFDRYATSQYKHRHLHAHKNNAPVHWMGRYLYVLLFIRRELSLVFGLQAAQAGFQLGEALVDNIRQILLVKIVRRAAFLVAHAHYLGGHAHGGAVGG